MTIRVLVVDDAATARLALRIAFEGETDFEVVGEAHDEASAIDAIERLDPDLVTMDVYLGRDNGIQATARIMRDLARPILVVSAASASDPTIVYRALEAGALDAFPKLPSPTHPTYEQRRRHFLRVVRTLAEVPVVRRRPRQPTTTRAEPVAARSASSPRETPIVRETPIARAPADGSRILVIGASTGGPPVLARLLAALPAPFPHPIVIVQHIMPGFTVGLAGWLADATKHRTRIIDSRARLEPGVVHLPSDDRHVVLASGTSIEANDDAARQYQRPSIDLLFESTARWFGGRAVALLLTGMGSDGAVGLAALHRAGAHTIAQSPETCAVGSMPRAAIALGAARQVRAPDELPEALRAAFQSSSSDETR